MISGVVTGDREARIRLSVSASSGAEIEVDLIVDTGFNGWISLSPSLIAELGLPWRRRGRAMLADGSETIFDIFEATVIWDHQPLRVWVDEVDAVPLVGMAMMHGYELAVKVWTGGSVQIVQGNQTRREAQ